MKAAAFTRHSLERSGWHLLSRRWWPPERRRRVNSGKGREWRRSGREPGRAARFLTREMQCTVGLLCELKHNYRAPGWASCSGWPHQLDQSGHGASSFRGVVMASRVESAEVTELVVVAAVSRTVAANITGCYSPWILAGSARCQPSTSLASPLVSSLSAATTWFHEQQSPGRRQVAVGCASPQRHDGLQPWHNPVAPLASRGELIGVMIFCVSASILRHRIALCCSALTRRAPAGTAKTFEPHISGSGNSARAAPPRPHNRPSSLQTALRWFGRGDRPNIP